MKEQKQKQMVRKKCQKSKSKSKSQSPKKEKEININSDQEEEEEEQKLEEVPFDIFAELQNKSLEIINQQCYKINEYILKFGSTGSSRVWLLVFKDLCNRENFENNIKNMDKLKINKFKSLSGQLLLIRLPSDLSYKNNFEYLENYGIVCIQCKNCNFDSLITSLKQDKIQIQQQQQQQQPQKRNLSSNSNNSNDQEEIQPDKRDKLKYQELLQKKLDNQIKKEQLMLRQEKLVEQQEQLVKQQEQFFIQQKQDRDELFKLQMDNEKKKQYILDQELLEKQQQQQSIISTSTSTTLQNNNLNNIQQYNNNNNNSDNNQFDNNLEKEKNLTIHNEEGEQLNNVPAPLPSSSLNISISDLVNNLLGKRGNTVLKIETANTNNQKIKEDGWNPTTTPIKQNNKQVKPSLKNNKKN